MTTNPECPRSRFWDLGFHKSRKDPGYIASRTWGTSGYHPHTRFAVTHLNRRSLHSGALSRKSSWETCSVNCCGLPPLLRKDGAPYTCFKYGSKTTNRGCPILRTALFRAKGGRPQMYAPPIFIPLGGPQAHEHSGRDDKVKSGCQPVFINPIFILLGGPQAP